jgi:hypothetical protein
MGEQGVQEGTLHTPLREPALRISVADVLLPTLTTWGQPIRKSRIQLQREVFCPRVLSLVISFEGTMILDALEYKVWRMTKIRDKRECQRAYRIIEKAVWK